MGPTVAGVRETRFVVPNRQQLPVPDNEIRPPIKLAELRFYSSSARECGTFEGRR